MFARVAFKTVSCLALWSLPYLAANACVTASVLHEDESGSTALGISSCPSWSAGPLGGASLGPADSLTTLCDMLVARSGDYGQPLHLCHEQQLLPAGFLLLKLSGDHNVAYVLAGKTADGWHSLESFDADSSNKFEISHLQTRTLNDSSILLTFDATETDRYPRTHKELLEAIYSHTVVCARSADNTRQKCFALWTLASWSTYEISRGPQSISEAGALIRADQVKALVSVSSQGLVRHQVLDYEKHEQPGDPRCYFSEHDMLGWDEQW